MPDRQRAMLGNVDLRDDDVVARRAFQADRPPGVDDLDLAARQGVVTVDIDAVLLGGRARGPTIDSLPLHQEYMFWLYDSVLRKEDVPELETILAGFTRGDPSILLAS
jgi:hypothetical protein